MARLKDYYLKEVIPALIGEFKYKNPMQVPKMEKIVVNMGLGEAIQNVKIIDSAVQELAAITGQKPVVNKAKNRSPLLSSVRECPLVVLSRCASKLCMNFLIVWLMLLCLK